MDNLTPVTGGSSSTATALDQAAKDRREERPTAVSFPVPVGSFVGREVEIDRVCGYIRHGGRLITVTGTGGVGKTRCALEIGRRMGDDFDGQVVFVSLASLQEVTLVPVVLTRILGDLAISDEFNDGADDQFESTHSSDPIDPVWRKLAARMRNQRALLVIDNFEHVLGAAPLLSDFLRHCPGVVALVTSRVALRLSGEQQVRLSPFACPDHPVGLSLPEISTLDCVRLFVDRSEEVRSDFLLTDANAQAVLALCTRLDGVPLAIELAAARLRALSLDSLIGRLNGSLNLLSDGQLDLPVRHRSMAETIAWSYGLLPSELCSALLSLSVFSGGFELSAAQYVLGPSTAEDALDILTALVDSSLVSVSINGRFSMLAAIREFAHSEMGDGKYAEEVFDRHATYWTDLAVRSAEELVTSDAPRWLEQLELEHDNFRSALRWLLTHGFAGRAQSMAGSLHWFWFLHSHFVEGQRWLEEAIAGGVGEPVDPLASLGLGVLTYDQADYETASTSLLRAAELARAKGQHRTEVRAILFLGLVAYRQGRYEDMHTYLKECLTLARTQEYRWGVAVTLCSLGLSVPTIDASEARSVLEEGLSVFRRLGDPWGLARAANALGEHARLDGDFSTARSLYEESIERYLSLGNENSAALVSHNLACVAMAEGEYISATSRFAEGLRLHRKHGDRRGVAHCLAGLAGALGRCGETELACRLLGTAEVLFEVTGSARDPVDREAHDRNVEHVELATGAAAFARYWRQGRDLSVDAAISTALGAATVVCEDAAEKVGSLAPVGAPPRGPRLTPREFDVLRLLVNGDSDQQIAEQLGISRKTASRHVESILSKLGVKNRTGAATLAVRSNLV